MKSLNEVSTKLRKGLLSLYKRTLKGTTVNSTFVKDNENTVKQEERITKTKFNITRIGSR